MQYVAFDYLDALHWEINLNRPALAYLVYYDTGRDESVFHIVVVYGYQTFSIGGEEIDGFVAHFGWKNSPWNLWFNEDWVNGMMTFQTSHVHNDKVLNENDAHVLVCDDCKRTRITGEHTYRKEQYKYDIDTNGNGEVDQVYSDEMNHKVICSCGYYYLEGHTFIEHSNIDDNYHESKCICGYYGNFAHWYKFGECRFCKKPENR